MSQISKQAKSALLAAQGRTGAAVPTRVPGDQTDLLLAGLVTAKGNLTAKGQRERARIARQMEEEAFGA